MSIVHLVDDELLEDCMVLLGTFSLVSWYQVVTQELHQDPPQVQHRLPVLELFVGWPGVWFGTKTSVVSSFLRNVRWRSEVSTDLHFILEVDCVIWGVFEWIALRSLLFIVLFEGVKVCFDSLLGSDVLNFAAKLLEVLNWFIHIVELLSLSQSPSVNAADWVGFLVILNCRRRNVYGESA